MPAMKLQSALLTAAIFALQCVHTSAATLHVDLNSTNPTPPYADWSTAATNIQDAVDAATNGDLVLVTNGVYATGGVALVFRPLPGGGYTEWNRVSALKAVNIQSVNGRAVTFIEGYQLPGTIFGTNAARCVFLTNGASLSGFTLMGGATRIGGDGGGIFCFSNATVFNCTISNNAANNSGGGVYGGVLSNCTLVQNSATNGGGAASSTLNNCLIIGNSAYKFGGGAYSNALSNCTFTANSAASAGGGAAFSTLNNCTLNGNSATNVGGGAFQSTLNYCSVTSNLTTSAKSDGGGASSSTLNNCALTGNSAPSAGGANICTLNDCIVYGNSASQFSGGGEMNSTLNNCTLSGNSAINAGGGAYGGTLNNCIVYFNTASTGPDYNSVALNYCCTAALPAVGTGNITNEPAFVDVVNGDFHLQSNSPCINAGNNSYVTNSADLDGNPRIVGGTVDIGAYEYQTPTSIISYAWLQQYGLPTDGSADFIDSDGDGMSNWQEWRAGTDPTDPLSELKMLTVSNSAPGLTVTWESVNTRTYYLQRSADLQANPAFSTMQSNIVGQTGTTSFTDTTATNGSAFFYRVGVQ
jgi:hypothetical protein